MSNKADEKKGLKARIKRAKKVGEALRGIAQTFISIGATPQAAFDMASSVMAGENLIPDLDFAFPRHHDGHGHGRIHGGH